MSCDLNTRGVKRKLEKILDNDHDASSPEHQHSDHHHSHHRLDNKKCQKNPIKLTLDSGGTTPISSIDEPIVVERSEQRRLSETKSLTTENHNDDNGGGVSESPSSSITLSQQHRNGDDGSSSLLNPSSSSTTTSVDNCTTVAAATTTATPTTTKISSSSFSLKHSNQVSEPDSMESEEEEEDEEDEDDDDVDDSDDDDDDEDEEEDEDDIFNDDQYDAKKDLYVQRQQNGVVCGGGADSESGYEERASSNSSLLSDSSLVNDDSSSIEFNMPPAIGTGSSDSCYSSPHLDLGATAQNFYLNSNTSTIGNSNNGPVSISNSQNPVNGYYCAYSMAPSSPTNTSSSKTTAHYGQLQTLQAHSFNSNSNGPTCGRSPPSTTNYLHLQRQKIFNISMCKLTRFRQSSDPSLHRSVMICNTLRMLEKELEKEGLKVNFGPNGVSFISPVVPAPPDLDFLPMLQPQAPSPLLPLSSVDMPMNGCVSVGDSPSPSPFNVLASSPTTEHNIQYGQYQPSQPNDSSDACSADYDKYFTIDRGSSSGRATPFVKSTFTDYSNRATAIVDSNQMNSTVFWQQQQPTSPDDQMLPSDRLSNLNWSSMFNSSTSSTTISNTLTNNSEAADSRQHQRYHQQSSPSLTSQGPSSIMMPYPDAELSASQTTYSSSSAPSSSCSNSNSISPSTTNVPSVSNATFATLLPPASSMLTSMTPVSGRSSSIDQNSSSSFSNGGSNNNNNNSTYFSSSTNNNNGMLLFTSSNQNVSNNQNGSVLSTSATTLHQNSSSYMNSFVSCYSTTANSLINGATETEIFGDIDLSLYDFDLLSPLSPPNKASITSAEELIRNMNSSSSSTTTTSTTSSIIDGSNVVGGITSLTVNAHFMVNGFSGQCSYTSMSSTNNNNNTHNNNNSQNHLNSQLIMPSSMTMISSSSCSATTSSSITCSTSSSNPGSCGLVVASSSSSTSSTPSSASSVVTSFHHLHTASGGARSFVYKTPDQVVDREREQTMTNAIKCHN